MTVKEWIAQEQGKHFCQCGCGSVIIITKYHRYNRGPFFCSGHNSKLDKKHLAR